MRKMKSNIGLLAALALGASFGMESELYESKRGSRPSTYPRPKGAHQHAEAIDRAQAKRDRKAAKRLRQA